MQVRKEKIDIFRRLLNDFEAENDSYSQGQLDDKGRDAWTDSRFLHQ